MKVKFYKTSSGKSPVFDFISALPDGIRDDFFDATQRLAEGDSLAMPVSKSLGSIHPGLNELRFRDRSGAYRVIYYIKKKDGIYMLHAFKKKTQKTPQKELRTALKRLKEL